ncbi:aBC superfamily ATP binding cassette transporter membrane protein [Coprobacillus sp. CAG:826]|nr:ABC transporter permease [Coprobacillus sp.]CDD91925.1 aBC superfamily ATP binding cassette transporter membrane protein [Coprobacillus sp. CAG:826]
MMKRKISSLEDFKKEKRRKKGLILFSQFALLFLFLASWELFARLGVINTFLVSKPSDIWNLFFIYLKNGEIFRHMKVSLLETLYGLVIGTGLGILIGILLWWFPTLSRILDPFLVVLNALPKTALAPILIIWAGTGMKGIVVVAISLSIVITILSSYHAFNSIDEEQIKMMKTLGASKWQILIKLILPANIPNLINIVKINIGMAWVGVIVGEFLVSREGIGYLVVYGGQVFKLDLVMMGVFILGVLALLMYLLLNGVEKYFRTYRYHGRRKKK